jgi:hypothetical protein
LARDYRDCREVLSTLSPKEEIAMTRHASIMGENLNIDDCINPIKFKNKFKDI